ARIEGNQATQRGVEEKKRDPHGNLQPVQLRSAENQARRIEITFGNCLIFTSRRAFVSKQKITGTAHAQEGARLGIDRLGMLLGYLDTAKRPISIGLR